MSDSNKMGKAPERSEEAAKSEEIPPPPISNLTAEAPTSATVPAPLTTAPVQASAPFSSTSSISAPAPETNPEYIIYPEVSVIVSPSPDPVPDASATPSPPSTSTSSKAPEVKPETSNAVVPTEVTVTPNAPNSVPPPKSEQQKASENLSTLKTGNLQPPSELGAPGTPTKQAESKLAEHPPESPEESEPSQSKPDLTKGEEKAIEAVNAFKTGLFRRKLVDLKLVSQNTLHEKINEEDIDGTGNEEELVDDHDEVKNTRIKFIAGFLLAISLIVMIIVQSNTLAKAFAIDTTAREAEAKANILRYDAAIARIGLQTSDPGFPDPRVECGKESGRLKMTSRRCYYQYDSDVSRTFWEAVEFCESRGSTLAYPRNEDEIQEIGNIFKLKSGSLFLGAYGDENGRVISVDSAREILSDYLGWDWTNDLLCLTKAQSRQTLAGASTYSFVVRCDTEKYDIIICMNQF